MVEKRHFSNMLMILMITSNYMACNTCYTCYFLLRIEKSRSILPSMQQAAMSCPKGKQLNWEYFYELLFTTDNLKLVEISCHKKDAHKGYDCDEKKYYTGK